jgi:FAD/FMN-containing dehydrogenase
MQAMTETAHALSSLLGPKGWLTGEDAEAFQRDWLDRYGVPPLGVARPACTAEIAAVVAICHAARIGVVAQGGNTGLCGGAVAHRPDTVILSLARMTHMEAPRSDRMSIIAEAGVVLATLHEAVGSQGLIFPMHLGAEGSARIGGLIGTNAGGSHAFRYGTMQDLVLGMEVVLPDGTIWDGLRAVQKDNAGYQLRKLFCGSEGTLGIVARAALKLFPAPKRRATALVALSSYAAAEQMGARLVTEAGEFISGLEFFSELGVGLALKHLRELGFPLGSRGPVYVLAELASASERAPVDEILSAALERDFEDGLLVDGAVAMSEEQRALIWRLREEQPEGQRLEGAQLKHDISVPPHALAEFIEAGAAVCEQILPGVRVNPFGHLADGNIHYNLSPPEGHDGFGVCAESLGQALAELASRLGGSFAAEHGLGRAKVALADTNRGAVERQLMARIKAAVDPGNIMNPGVIVSGSR